MLFNMLCQATVETIYMVGISGLLALLFGLPLGILLFLTANPKLHEMIYFNHSLSFLVNIVRSVPFIILLIAIIPVTRLIVGSSIGTNAAIVPLSLAAIPFLARLVEGILHELPSGLIEAAIAMGASPAQIVWRFLLPESMPGIISCFCTTLINLIGYSAMAGAVGGGGLGDLAIRYGYQRFDSQMMLLTVIILIVLVQGLQTIGQRASQFFRR